MIAISASIVLYKPDSLVFETIRNILACDLKLDLYLVDNSPTDVIKDDLAAILRNEQVHYIFNKKKCRFWCRS